MPGRAVRNHRMWHAVLAQLPSCKFRALISRPGLGDPYVERSAAIVCGIDRCRSRTVIHKGEPSRVAMCKHIHGLAALVSRNLLTKPYSVLPNLPAVLFLFFGN